MTRYAPSRQYFPAGLIALGLSAFSAWCGLRWAPAWIPSVLFLLSAGLLFFLASRPPIEVHDQKLVVGNRSIPWADIRRLDRTGWISPLIVHLTLADDKKVLLLYPGDLDSANSLLRNLRRGAREALIDGIPYREFWGEPAAGADRKPAAPKYRVVSPEDEAEVERLYQRLKTVGRLDPKNTSDEK